MSEEWCDFVEMMDDLTREDFEATLKDLMRDLISQYGLKPVEIEFVDGLEEADLGRYYTPSDSAPNGKIQIARDTNRTNSEAITTAFHEFAHAVQDEYTYDIGIDILESEIEDDAADYADEMMEDLQDECGLEITIESIDSGFVIIINE